MGAVKPKPEDIGNSSIDALISLSDKLKKNKAKRDFYYTRKWCDHNGRCVVILSIDF